MKTKTIWIIVGVIVAILVVVYLYNQSKKNTVTLTIPAQKGATSTPNCIFEVDGKTVIAPCDRPPVGAERAGSGGRNVSTNSTGITTN